MNKMRIAIVDQEKCKPKNCQLECKRYCPVVKTGKLCVQVKKKDTSALISESLCTGCGICVKKCPQNAIKIINLPKALSAEVTIHRYGANGFKLFRLPTPRLGKVLGLVGINGIGKSTALKILGNKIKPNLGDFDYPSEWDEILSHFKGSELFNYFNKLKNHNLVSIIKPQYVDNIPKKIKGLVGDIIEKTNEHTLEDKKRVLDMMSLTHLMNSNIATLSGGELQRLAIAVTMLRKADMYMFDEPSSYLDVKQRINAALAIRTICKSDNYVLCVEHDLAILDYLSDYVCVLYGTPGAYGAVTLPYSVREGINVFLAGYIPNENMRFRPYPLTFKISTEEFEVARHNPVVNYPAMQKTLQHKSEQFVLSVEQGGFNTSEITVLLGENGTGKSTFIRLLAGELIADADADADDDVLPELAVSLKPQKIQPNFPGSVRELLQLKLKNRYTNPQFQTDVFKPLRCAELMDQKVKELSGGQLQRVALCLALGKPAQIYLLDEPSAYLDSEQRLISAKVIKQFIMHSRKTAFIVEHDFIMATYLADKVIVFSGEPHVQATASAPQTLLKGMNLFLSQLDITFRRDSENWRPRINKYNSVKDAHQKKTGQYFFSE